VCLLKRWSAGETTFGVKLPFVASLFSHQNCCGTREITFKRRSKQPLNRLTF